MAKSSTAVTVISALLIMEASSLEFRIEPNVRNLLVATGSELVLDCLANISGYQSVSPSSLTWTGPKNAIFSTRTRTDNQVIYHSFLTVASFSLSDVGTYTCTFRAASETTEARIELFTVIENKREGDFSFGNKSAILECTLEFPESSVSGTFREWLKDNTVLFHTKNPETKFTDSKNGTLFINSPSRTDSGLYTARYEVTVAGEDQTTYDCEVVYSAAPLVLDMSRSKNLIEGEDLHLDCVIKGYPHANVTWLRNNEPVVEEKDRVSMDDLNGYENAQLNVLSVRFSDAGNYTCLATDKIGRKSSKSITVRVKDNLDWLWPVLGILGEAIVLAIIIFVCSKLKKDDQVEKPADEREGLLRQGSSRGNNKNE